MKPTPQAQNIDEVIRILEDIITQSKTESSPLGYFAALYLLVTSQVKKGIEENFFDDGPRMEKLDVLFANRYLAAYYSHQQSQSATLSWEKSFALSSKYWPIVLQHLLMGMNAHINLDLGIAAAQVMKDKNIDDLEGDFNKINEVLSSLVHKVQQDLAEIWPTLRFILKLTGKVDDALTDFSMKLARDGAWKFAKQLSELDESKQEEFISLRDHKVADKSKIIAFPGWLVSTLFKVIRLGERGSVSQKIVKLRD